MVSDCSPRIVYNNSQHVKCCVVSEEVLIGGELTLTLGSNFEEGGGGRKGWEEA